MHKKLHMKYLLILLCFIIPDKVASATINTDDIANIKQAMMLAVESPRVTDSLYTELSKRNSSSALIIAYAGTLEALKAKHSWNPYQKLKYVARSQKTLETALKAEPNNLEIRFMRFSIQHYTPAFLGYSKEISEDRQMIIKQFSKKNFGQTDAAFRSSIAKFMIMSDRCTPEEVKLLRKYI
jgi:hypothetical protein